MKFSALLILILTFQIQLSFAQTDCKKIENYTQLEKWIDTTNTLPLEEKKETIFLQIICENSLPQRERFFDPLWVIDGVPLASTEISNQTLELFRKSNFKTLTLLPPLKEGYPQRRRGILLLETYHNGVLLNNSQNITVSKIKKNKNYSFITLKSDAKASIQINIMDFAKLDSVYSKQTVLLKKGINRLKIKKNISSKTFRNEILSIFQEQKQKILIFL